MRAAWICFSVFGLAAAARAADWPEWRGPARDGSSSEPGLPERWSPSGAGLAFKAPYGARSAPVVFGKRLYIQSPKGQGQDAQERVVCLDADSGQLVWEHAFPVFHTDVPPHRLGWASPAVDPLTGHVFSLGVHGELRAIDTAGKLLWSRSLTEEFGAITTHGGRTVSPLVEDGLVVVSTLTSGWGEQARGNNRWFAFDKTSGASVWVSAPQPLHYDTNYGNAVVADVDGARLLIAGGTDGAMHALQLATGRPVWRYEMSKRALNTVALVRGSTAIVTHSEENHDTSEMGQLAALDARAKGALGKEQLIWRTDGFQGGFSSPVQDAERIYAVDNGAVLAAFEARTGRKLWDRNLGTIQKASLVLADGKLYVGTENGRFFVLRPRADGVDVLDDDLLGTPEAPEAVIGSVAVARGRVYLASMQALYAIGPKGAPRTAAAPPAARPALGAPGEAAFVQVRPAEVLMEPGGRVSLSVRLYDDKGRFVREAKDATFTLEGLSGELHAGEYVAPAEGRPQAGLVKASVGALTGSARLRVLPRAPLSEDFESATGEAPPAHWINSTGKFLVREHGGSKALMKRTDIPLTKRGRLFVSPPDWHDYSVQADVLSTDKRRQMGDGGVIAQRYVLALFGNSQKLELLPWQANAARTRAVPFAWQPETWYRLRLRVENRPDGSARVQGKAWPAAEPEPGAWTVELIDPHPHSTGAAGIYADAPVEIFFDNLKVEANR